MDYYTKIRQYFGNEEIILSGAVGEVVKEDKLLLVRRHNLSQTWGFPGGVQELGETIKETAHREVLEEIDLDMQVRDLISVYSGPQWDIDFTDGGGIQHQTFFFQMEGRVDEVAIQESEVAEWGFYSPNRLPENIMP